MGYTHYWYRPQQLNPEQFKLLASDANQLFLNAVHWNVRLGDASGSQAPIVTDALIVFNGVGFNAHESMVIERDKVVASWETEFEGNMYFQFCKTAHKPYDLIVQAVLIALKHHFPEVLIHSDGYTHEWNDARSMCQDVLGYGSDFELDDRDPDEKENGG